MRKEGGKDEREREGGKKRRKEGRRKERGGKIILKIMAFS